MIWGVTRQAVGSGHSGGDPGKSLAGNAKEIMAEPEGCSSTFTFFFFLKLIILLQRHSNSGILSTAHLSIRR